LPVAKVAATRKRGTRFRFFGDIIGELRKVVWPTRQEAIRLTLMVLAVCIVVGLIMFGVDYGFARLVGDVFL